MSRRFIRDRIREEARQTPRPFNGQVYDIPSAEYCRVLIQGSNVPLVAWFSRTGYHRPPFVAVGAALQLQYKEGNRAFVEVSGPGTVIPTPPSGGLAPVVPAGGNGILSGLAVVQSAPASMDVIVPAGTFRIAGTTYSQAGDTVTVAAAPSAGNYRYDLIVVGADGVLDYIEGTPSATPALPAVPSNHVLVATILIAHGQTEIGQAYINRAWTAAVASVLEIAIADPVMDWDTLATTATVTVKDQYGNGIAAASPGWEVTLAIVAGNGEVTSTEGGSGTSTMQHFGSYASYAFTYTRPHDGSDSSPILRASLTAGRMLSAQGSIELQGASAAGGVLAGGDQKITYAANITIDWSLGATAYLELTGDCTIALTNQVDGQVYRLILVQKDGGGHSVTGWTGVEYWQGGTAPALTAAVDHEDVITFLRAQSKTRAAATADFS